MIVVSVVITLDVITRIGAKKIPSGLPHGRQETDELFQLSLVQVAELVVVNPVDLVLDVVQQPQPRSRDPSDHEAANCPAAVPGDQPRLLQPIEQTGYIGDL